jgi:hypothetical protein
MTAPTPETLDWLRQCAAAPGARWHRALLADVEGQTPPEIEPIPAEGLAWLQQSARVHGATYSQVLLHVLERIELLDKDSIEQSRSNSFCFEAVIKRLEKLEAAENLRQQDEGDEHAVEPVTVDARDPKCVERWPDCHSEGYDSRCCRFPKSCSCGGEPPAPQPAPVAPPAGGLVERVVKVIADPDGPAELWHDDARAAIREVAAWVDQQRGRVDRLGLHSCSLLLREEADR